MKKVIVNPVKSLGGSITIPGDKSISHRALMFSSLAQGISRINNLLEGHDCIATVQVMRALGVHIELLDGTWIVKGQGKNSLKEPSSILDCKNSGTTMRLMAGLLSAMPFLSVLDGSDQIKSRPMDRILKPLRNMGANIYGRSDSKLAPIVTMPAILKGMAHELEVKSAQVKSALAIAALFAKGQTTINNIGATRDHSEKLLSFMGADIHSNDNSLCINPLANELSPIDIKVPGDISSAAFLLVAGALTSKDSLTLRQVGLNTTRIGIIDALKQMGAQISTSNETSEAGEPIGDIHVSQGHLVGAEFCGAHIVKMIDEIPILALAATQAQGQTVIKDAAELRVKESNRITKTTELLKSLGANIDETPDGMIIQGPTKLLGGECSSFGDHRLALMLAIAGLISQEPVLIARAEVMDDSFPRFLNALTRLGAKAQEV